MIKRACRALDWALVATFITTAASHINGTQLASLSLSEGNQPWPHHRQRRNVYSPDSDQYFHPLASQRLPPHRAIHNARQRTRQKTVAGAVATTNSRETHHLGRVSNGVNSTLKLDHLQRSQRRMEGLRRDWMDQYGVCVRRLQTSKWFSLHRNRQSNGTALGGQKSRTGPMMSFAIMFCKCYGSRAKVMCLLGSAMNSLVHRFYVISCRLLSRDKLLVTSHHPKIEIQGLNFQS
jgi:hypothetical protein